MVCQWAPWTQYGPDAVVEYECHLYKIIQPHQSEPNWQPPNTPALWSRLPDDCGDKPRCAEEPHCQTGGFVDQSGGNSGGAFHDRPPVCWLRVERSDAIPGDAIEGGREGGQALYIGRANYENGVHVGKVSPRLGGCVIGFGGKELNDFNEFEILTGNKDAVKWVNHSENQGAIRVQGDWRPVEGGREADGRSLFVCQVQYEDGVHPCKAADGSDFAIFTYGGKEHTKKEFNILAYA